MILYALSPALPKRTHRRGLTLIEALLATVVLAFTSIAVTQAVVVGQMQTMDALRRARALEMAEALVDEVLRLPYADPNGTGGEVGRTNFDDVADYHGFSEATGTLSDLSGTAYASPYQGFSRAVTVVAAGGGGISVTEFGDPLPGLVVSVTVQDSAGATWTLTRFKAQPPE
ncbi:MAG: hypothetical protein GY842_24665 [bacterium]|nr:hypothetical protein [bacterium]